MRSGRRYTRHKLSAFAVLALEQIRDCKPIYVGKTYRMLERKALIEPIGLVTDGKMGRALLTPEGTAAYHDAVRGGWRKEFART